VLQSWAISPHDAEIDVAYRPARRKGWTFLWLYVSILAATSLWALATPLYGSPDELAHARKAAATVRGESIGRRTVGPSKAYRTFLLPNVFAQGNPSCFAFQPLQAADCQVIHKDPGQSNLVSTASLYPPLYYAWTGLPSLLTTSTDVLYFMRIMSAAICSFFLAIGLWMLRYIPAPRTLIVGVAAAVTPMVLFLSGMVNPSALEIASAFAVWVGACNILRLGPRTPTWMLAIAVLSACVLSLTRTLSPLWLLLIFLVLVIGLGHKQGLQLLKTGRGIISVACVSGAVLVQSAWVVGYGLLNVTDQTLGIHSSDSAVLRGAAGEINRLWREMVGVFGWLDTASPTLTYVLWLVLLGSVVGTALLFATRRGTIALWLLGVLIVLLPIGLEYRLAPVQGWTWQGRYTLPLAIGLPILAVAVVRRRRLFADGLHRYRLFVACAAGLANFMSFYWALRRYTVGAASTIWPWYKPKWVPPGGVVPLLVAFAVSLVSFYFVLCADHPISALPDFEPSLSDLRPETADFITAPDYNSKDTVIDASVAGADQSIGLFTEQR
jgi:hypothetical protein